MSGQPYVYASDPERYRAMYMENLNTTAKMDDLVLQAVKEYTQTGMIPPAAQLIDNRTTSEKLADIEKLKIGIVKDLEPLMDPNTALTLVKGLSQSPLNSDNKLIVFFAQAGKSLVEEIKKLFKYGIKGDANDIETFVDFINNAYAKKLKGVQSVKELIQSSNTGRDLLSTTSLQQYVNFMDDIFHQIVDLNHRSGGGYDRSVDNKITGIKQIVQDLIDFMPNDQELADMKMLINADSPNTQLYTMVFDFMRTELPKKEVIGGLLNQGNSAIKGKNLGLAIQVVNNLYSMLSPLFNSLGIFIEARDALEDEMNPGGGNQPPGPPGPPGGDDQPRPAPRQPRIPPPAQNIGGASAPGGAAGGTRVARTPVSSSAPVAGTYISNLAGNAGSALGAIGNPFGLGGRGSAGLRRRPGRPRGSGMPLHLKIDPKNKIEPMPQYTQFGKFLINNHRLSEDIMSLRSGKGHVIKDMPPFKLTPPFKKVIKKITGGSIPTEDDINSLTDEEIKFLNKLSKRANVYDALNIPTPSKSKEEQDMHDFEVMKGEIMSGNDNKDLIKKFKILLMRFHKQGRIPKNEYNEIMEDLMTLSI